MGNKNDLNYQTNEQRVFFSKFSNNLNFPAQPNKNPPKLIDKEHVTISRIFRITLDEKEKDKYEYLEEYLAQILSMNKETKFRIANLDEIIFSILQTKKNNILDYLFETYHRSIEMIEKRFKNEYDENYKKVHQILSNYICNLLNNPENLGLEIPNDKIQNSFNNYFNDLLGNSEKDSNFDELGFILYDFYNSCIILIEDENMCKNVFKLFFDLIDSDNKKELENNFFGNREKILKNSHILSSLFQKCPKICKFFIDLCLEDKKNKENFESNYLLQMLGMNNNNNNNGKSFQKNNYLSTFLDVSPLDLNIEILRKKINLYKPRENDIFLEGTTKKLNDYLDDISLFFINLYHFDPDKNVLKYLYKLINVNFDKIKMVKNELFLSSNGFLLNCIFLLFKIIFYEFEKTEKKLENYSHFIFKIVGNIDPLYTLTKDKIDFTKFEKTNPFIVKEILNDESMKNSIPSNFNIYTELFFLTNVLITFTLKNVSDYIKRIDMMINEFIKKNGQNIKSDVNVQNAIILSKIFCIYLKNNDFHTNLLRFCEVGTFFIFSLNNKKYSQSEFQKNYTKINYKEFLDDFYTHLNINDNFTISLLPENIYSNIITMAEFIRNFRPDSLMEHLSCTKAIIYFSLIFSCNANLIQNPHFRMQIFDIMIYFFIINDNEKNNKISRIFELLKEKFIKESLMVSILKVFVDAERLGTSNQFYEKFSVRYKILYLIDNINKGYGQLFEENIKDYTKKYPEESTKMINLLMNDITFLNDEIIENLSVIKQYQDLIEDEERYKNVTEENKKYEEGKFKEKDRIVKQEINLFNSGLKFLVSISKVLQTNFEKSNLCQNLANLLNYSLNIFITPRGNEIKVKNLNQYDFDPKFILASILTIYSSFIDSNIFIEFVIKDERSYKYENFEKALNFVRNKRNIPIKGEDFDNYEKLVKKIKELESKIKSEQINYDDAPDEFLDAITTILMDDPVKLPTSHVIVDRKTIEHHLLSDQTDPFNRTKLTKDMLIPCPELKAKIDEYKKKKKKIHDKNQNKMDVD